MSAASDFGSLFDLYDQSEEARASVSHNVEILKCVRGGLRMSEHHRIPFEPRGEYWRLPERRLLVAYFADRWTGHFAPAVALRGVARRVFLHFDQARRDAIVSYRGTDYDQAGGFKKVCAALADHARRLPPLGEWDELRVVWPKLAETAGDDIARFLQDAPDGANWEPGFKRRLPWFGYLGASSEEDLRNRQAFFFGYANLWTTANAYTSGGGMAFAPVIQNTSADRMIDAALQWAAGTNPIQTTFSVLGRDDADNEPLDRSLYATVVEVYGFLNLARAPFYNNRAEIYRNWFDLPDDLDAYEMTAAVGQLTAAWLNENPAAVDRLCALFRQVIEQPPATRVEFEGVELPKKKKQANTSDDLLDVHLLDELETAAKSELRAFSSREAANLALHLLLDGKLWVETKEGSGKPIKVTTPEPPRDRATDKSPHPSESLPAPLRPLGERALAYLRGGFHVLFAGAPGTGKTTLAQVVGYTWDSGLGLLPERMPAGAAPLTTVGNSAWSPFHTIGGLMPAEKGTFTCHPGIFIDPASTSADTWRLRDGAVVLDEMNRADLDRCIGELYPLLSGTVDRVSPAGLPGVRTIEASPRFRVIATINDANLDDIVFPISEGLARRFQRIELLGASRDDVLEYLGLAGPEVQQAGRRSAVYEAVADFIDIARELNLLVKAEDDDRLPFGVAYFAPLRAWVQGKIDSWSTEATDPEQARDLLAGSLRTLERNKWSGALRRFLAKT